MVLPVVVMADRLPQPGTNLDIEKAITSILKFIWPIFGSIAGAMFIYAGYLYVTAAGDPGKIKSANLSVIWGIIGISLALLSFMIPWIIFSILE